MSGNRTRTLAAVTLVVAMLLSGIGLAMSATPSQAATASDFDAGNIIDDNVFFNPGAMSAAQVQSFLDSKSGSCAPGHTCLRSYRQDTPNRQADLRCSGYSGAGGETAAQIIWRVAQSCNVNPQVLIVLLQKEQGLVTSGSPSTGRYQKATGFACPDTAPCDTAYYGFFNQVYAAARQFQVYVGDSGSFRYRAGQNNQIQWHPNAGCGSSTVYIQNKATAALYNYTPYRPNSAALTNLYGLGDGCSSYGNRNFFTYFVDWFGSVRGSSLVRTATDPTVYLVSETSKTPVPSMAVLADFSSLGGVRIVADQTLAKLATTRPLSNLVRDPGTGSVYLVSAGVRYHFSDCGRVADYGLRCSDYVDIPSSQVFKLSDGGEVGAVASVPGSPVVYRVSRGSARPVYDWTALVALEGGSPRVASMPRVVADGLQQGPVLLGPGTMTKTAASPEVSLIDGLGARIPLSSFDLPNAIGARTITVVDPSLYAAYPTRESSGSTMLDCGSGGRFVAGDGAITPTTSQNGYGLPVTVLDALTCAQLPRTGASFDRYFFARDQSTGVIWAIDGAMRRPVYDMTALQGLAGQGRSLTWKSIAPATLDAWAPAPVVLGPGTIVGAPGDSRLFVVDGAGARSYLSSFSVAADLGLPGTITVPPAAVLSAYPETGTLDGSLITCGSSSYLGASGMLYPIGSSYGLTPKRLDPATCSSLRVSGSGFGDAAYAADDAGTVFRITSEGRRPVLDWATLTALGGTALTPRLSEGQLARWVRGPAVLAPGMLVKGSDPAVYLVDGWSRLRHVGSLDLMQQSGWSSPVATVPDLVIRGYSDAEYDGIAVICGSTRYVPGDDELRPVTNTADGLPAVTLDPATCAASDRSPVALPRPVLVKPYGSSTVYTVSGGQLHPIGSWDRLVALTGTSAPVILPWRNAVTDLVPRGGAA